MDRDNSGVGSDISDSIYKEAVTKLKILLSATEPNMEHDVGGFNEQLARNRYKVSKSLDHLNDVDKSDAERKPSQIFAKLPPKQPSSSVRRQLFPSPAKTNGYLRSRHNSWHNLTHLEGDSGLPGGSGPGTDILGYHASPPSVKHLSRPGSPVGMSPAVKELVQRQEIYISQLEKEAAFCRDQLSNILLQVKQVLVANSNEAADDKAKKEEMMKMLKSLESEVKSRDQFQLENKKYQEENLILKQQLSKTEKNTVTADESSSTLIANLRKEVDILKAREAEAAEQVQKSVKVAEQIRQQKSEAEFEIGQLSSQVERQQVRIRSLIEEQVSKVEEERGKVHTLK